MFGYIRPYSDELKIKDFELFRSVYCTLCHTLKNEYGHASRFILNFDFTFLAMLLSPECFKPECTRKSCAVSPIKKRKVFCNAPQSFEVCAAYSIILSYWKLMDSVADDGFFDALKARGAALFLKRAYKKAVKSHSEFDTTVRENLRALSEMEHENTGSIDRVADKFALILSSAAEAAPEKNRRILSDMLYHTGRWIYLVDAYNDLADDLKTGSYNPIAAKYGISDYSEFGDGYREEIELTITNSLGRVNADYELMDDNIWSPIIRNIIYLGMPNVFENVKMGTFLNDKETIDKIGDNL